MEYSFSCNRNEPKEAIIEELINRSYNLEPADHLVVFNYGEYGNLRLDIYKDEDYDKQTGDYNFVRIYTSQRQLDGEMIDIADDEDIPAMYVELSHRLNYIYLAVQKDEKELEEER